MRLYFLIASLICFLLPNLSRADESAVPAISGYSVTVQRTEGSIQTLDGLIEYEVNTGTLKQADDSGDDKADVFFVAYHKKTAEPSERPVSFCFNGGPGSSSVWLHLGMLGPRRVVMPEDASPVPFPHRLEDNPMSLLAVTDLVFIDPVSTGYSRPTKDEKKEQFHGFEEDIRSVSQFIHDWTTLYGRWSSPKFLVGESYGGIRAAGVAARLQDRYHMPLNGAVIVSGAINFQTLRFDPSNDVTHVVFFPTYAASAWYHHRLTPRWQNRPIGDVIAAAEEFAIGKYASALMQGTSLPQEQQRAVAENFASLTGLNVDYVLRSNLRVSQSRFGKELLRDQRLTLGRFDSRYTGIDRDAAGADVQDDPSASSIFGAFTATMNEYLSKTLRYTQPRPYEILTPDVQPWNFSNFTNRFVDGSDDLRSVMAANPNFKLYVTCGYYDLATPHLAMKFTLDHLELPPERLANIRVTYHESGHMIYTHKPSMEKLYHDLVAWYRAANSPTPSLETPK